MPYQTVKWQAPPCEVFWCPQHSFEQRCSTEEHTGGARRRSTAAAATSLSPCSGSVVPFCRRCLALVLSLGIFPALPNTHTKSSSFFKFWLKYSILGNFKKIFFPDYMLAFIALSFLSWRFPCSLSTLNLSAPPCWTVVGWETRLL